MSSFAWLIDLGPSSIALQAAQALIAALVFGLFHRRYANPALAPWTLAWLASFAHAAGWGVMEWLAPRLATPGVAMTVLAAATLLAGYLKLGWLLLGTAALATGRPPRRVLSRGATAAALALAALTVVPAAAAPDGELVRYVARAGTFAVICGLLQISAGVLLLGARRQVRQVVGPERWITRHELGRLLVACALLGLGMLTITSFALTVGIALGLEPAARAELVPVAPVASGLHLLLTMKLALGLAIWLLEREQRRAEHRAYHDPLTGLPNRQLLVDRLQHQIAAARRTHQRFGVVFADVDRFKAINDTRGHAAGDRVLRAVAGRLSAALREMDTVARLGGDEFVVIATDLHRPDDVLAVAEKLRTSMHAPIPLEGGDATVTLSLGVAVYPDDGTDADALLGHADTALYRAKAEGRDAVRLVG